MKLFDTVQGSVQGFQFSGVRPESLGAMEYTLVTLVIDKTGSVQGFENELFAIKATVVDACKRSPRVDYLLLRVVEFNTAIDEVHGFKPLTDIDTSLYVTPRCYGSTALNDAVFSTAAACNAYAKTLHDSDYLTNGIIVVVTDGDDNASRMNKDEAKKALREAVQSEYLESMRAILIGVNSGHYKTVLEKYAMDVGFDQFEDIGNATPSKLAKVFDFVSRSISTQSQSLGTGGASQALTF